ncbi:MAG: hypothetical protein O3A00_27545, partial [Planctomycetota bacterium]|nr:hypothetical protein [Planctomycetota bacterium]
LPEGTGYSTRIRLPSESLAQRSANCLDATLLLASMLEGITLNPAIVLVPSHAMLGWERRPHTTGPYCHENWGVLEATAIGLPISFEQACDLGKKTLNHFLRLDQTNNTQTVKVWPLSDLRRRGVWPLE